MATLKVPALSVVSSREGFRRTHRAWSKTPTIIKLSELSDEEILMIKGEPMLTVTEVEIDEEVVDPSGALSKEERLAAIVNAIAQLDKEDGALWKSDGAPNAAAIGALTGFAVSAAERDEAWAQISSAE